MGKTSIGDESRAFDLIKAVADRLVALLLLPFASIIIFGVGIALKFQSPKTSVFFVQEREGHRGRPFLILKLRTMHPQRGTSSQLQMFCRATGIDELPQLLNIVRGEMSFVGPRPFSFEDLGYFSLEARHDRNRVRPGLVCHWQLEREHKKDWPSANVLDRNYVQNRSFRTDLWIVVQALSTVAPKFFQFPQHTTSTRIIELPIRKAVEVSPSPQVRRASVG